MMFRKSLVIVRWIGFVWLVSLALALILGAFAFFWGNSGAKQVRQGWQQQSVAKIEKGAVRIRNAAGICRVTLVLPASASLRLVPVVSGYVGAVSAGCAFASDIANAATTPSMQAVVKQLKGKTWDRTTLADGPLLIAAGEAMKDGRAYLDRASRHLDRIRQTNLPDGIEQDLAVGAKWLNPTRLESLSALVELAPTLLGVDKPRSYFVALLSDAEMRAGGGFLGQYAIVKFDQGRPSITKSGANASLPPMPTQDPDLLPGVVEITGRNNPEWVNINLSPHGPDAGRAALRGWRLGTGEELDGYISIDVDTAARLVVAAGEGISRADGVRLTNAEEIADYAQNGIYFDFPTLSEAAGPRKEFQVQVLQQLLKTAAESLMRIGSLGSVLPSAIEENRIVVWFADSTLQRKIAQSSVSHDLRANPHEVFITYNNGSGNKFDHYISLDPKVVCTSGGGQELTLKLRSSADPNVRYPLYIGQRLDDPSEKRASTFNQYLIGLPSDGRMRWARLDGELVLPRVVDLLGRPVVEIPFVLYAGETRTIKLSFSGTALSLSTPGSKPTALGCSKR